MFVKESQYAVIRDFNRTLAHVLEGGLKEEGVKAQVLTAARDKEPAGPSLGVLLYSLGRSEHFPENDSPIVEASGRKGETVEFRAGPPLYMTLCYVVTAWHKDPEEELCLLGLALRTFHDRPCLGSDDIQGESIYVEENPIVELMGELSTREREYAFSVLGIQPRLHFGVRCVARLDSGMKTPIRRVEERIVDFRKLE